MDYFVFDFDDTLYDYKIANEYALNNLLNDVSIKHNVAFDTCKTIFDDVVKIIKYSNNHSNKFNKCIYIKQFLEKIGVAPNNILHHTNKYNDDFNSKMNLFDGVLELFEYIKQMNFKICIITNNNTLQQLNKLNALNINNYIDIIVSSDEIGEEKPNDAIYINLLHKIHKHSNNCTNNVFFIGDNIEHDVIKSIQYSSLSVHFIKGVQFKVKTKYFEFGKYCDLCAFFKDYYQKISEFVHLSKYYGQSTLNVQGVGGNLSVKIGDLMAIKSSGFVMGNTENNTGFCVINNNMCKEFFKNNAEHLLNATKLFGYKNPSMETFFHSFMKTYTVHLHFLLSNIFLCSSASICLNEFKYKHVVVEYFTPGIILSKEIEKVYDETISVIFLKNHGIILTSNSITELNEIYCYTFEYFNKLLYNKYSTEYDTFLINQTMQQNMQKSCVVRHANNLNLSMFENLIFCFPDMAVFFTNITKVQSIDELQKLKIETNLLAIGGNMFIIADSITKFYVLQELIESYVFLHHNTNGNLLSIDNITFLRNMEQEKQRK